MTGDHVLFPDPGIKLLTIHRISDTTSIYTVKNLIMGIMRQRMTPDAISWLSYASPSLFPLFPHKPPCSSSTFSFDFDCPSPPPIPKHPMYLACNTPRWCRMTSRRQGNCIFTSHRQQRRVSCSTPRTVDLAPLGAILASILTMLLLVHGTPRKTSLRHYVIYIGVHLYRSTKFSHRLIRALDVQHFPPGLRGIQPESCDTDSLAAGSETRIRPHRTGRSVTMRMIDT